ncbi:MAG TPA: GNAT family N-acetyltransferase [Candidatus Acidoferrales bacterium]
MTARVEVLSTPRLTLRHLSATADAAFMLELLNEKPFLENIGDRGVRNLADAARYIQNGPVESYRQFGLGLYAVELKESGTVAGICGVLKRESLEFPDLGFAFLQKFWGQGYARESAEAVMHYARNTLGLKRIVAITKPKNEDSIRLLEKLGFHFEEMVQMPDQDAESRLFGSEA